ncbi:hypothetical protein JCM21900_000308 [Sporobolomyces salmonicolor]
MPSIFTGPSLLTSATRHPEQSITKRVRSNPSSYSPTELRTNLAAWGPILFYHLDAEVASLKPEVLRRYYTLEEVKRLPM